MASRINSDLGKREIISLFMGADLMAVYLPWTDSETTVITYSSTNRFEQHTAPIASNFDRNLPVNVVVITTTRNHWYQTKEIDTLAEILSNIPQIAKSRRIGYGSSMGSYGALLSTRPFRLHEVVAVAARTVITGGHAPLHPDSAKWVSEAPILADDVPGSASYAERVRLIYDSLLASDRAHAAYLRGRLPSIEELPLPFFGHPPYPPYQRAGITRQTFTDIVLGKTTSSEFHEIRRSLRRNSYSYWKNLASTARKRRHHAVVCHAAKRALSLFADEQKFCKNTPRWALLDKEQTKLVGWRDYAEKALARSGRSLVRMPVGSLTKDTTDAPVAGEFATEFRTSS